MVITAIVTLEISSVFGDGHGHHGHQAVSHSGHVGGFMAGFAVVFVDSLLVQVSALCFFSATISASYGRYGGLGDFCAKFE